MVDGHPRRAVFRHRFRSGLLRLKTLQVWITFLTFPLDRYISWVAVRAVHRTPFVMGDKRRVSLAPNTVLNNAVLNVVSGTIRIESLAFLGHNVSLLTGSHDIDQFGLERLRSVPNEGNDIVIEAGAWIASNAVILGPCRIGAHAVVAAGSVVTGDVASGDVVGGVPARRIRTLNLPDSHPPTPIP